MTEPFDREQFARWLEVEEGNVGSYEGLRNVPTEYVQYLSSKYAWLSENDYNEEAFRVLVLILRVVEYLPDPAERAKRSYWACRYMAVACSFFGLWQASIQGYERAITIGDEDDYTIIETSYAGPGGSGSAGQYRPAHILHVRDERAGLQYPGPRRYVEIG